MEKNAKIFVAGKRAQFSEKEESSLMALRRGVFTKRKIKNGEK